MYSLQSIIGGYLVLRYPIMGSRQTNKLTENPIIPVDYIASYNGFTFLITLYPKLHLLHIWNVYDPA